MAQLIRQTLLPTEHREKLLFMDIFGKRFEVYVNFDQASSRETMISDAIADLTTAEQKIKDYAAQVGHDLTPDLATGSDAIAKELART